LSRNDEGLAMVEKPIPASRPPESFRTAEFRQTGIHAHAGAGGDQQAVSELRRRRRQIYFWIPGRTR
jgi:hypothetical protein